MNRLSSADRDACALPSELFSGTRYRLKSPLAFGHAGELFVVEHVELGKCFAAKLLRREYATDARVVDRLRLEAQALGRLRHPNVVAITGFDRTSDGRPFIVMELLTGRTLAEEIALRGALPLAEALDLMLQILSALDAVHALGVVHRDVQPKHLLLHEPATGPRVPKVLDFGIVRVVDGTCARAPSPLALPTRTGVVVGNPEFASPESIRGNPVDRRSDIYQAGLVLYHMLTGCGPKYTSTISAAGFGRASSMPEPPSRRSTGGLPVELDAIVLRALSADPEARFQSAAEFRCALAQIHAAEPSEVSTLSDGTSRGTDPVCAGASSNAASEIEPRFRARVAARSLLFLLLSTLVALVVVSVGRCLRGTR